MTDLLESLDRRRRLPPPPLRRAIRQASGATQREVAAALGVHRVSVARWEAGTRTPGGDLRDRYTELLARLGSLS